MSEVKIGYVVFISSLTGKCAKQKFKNFCSFLWSCLHRSLCMSCMLRSKNKITDILMTLAWLSPFNQSLSYLYSFCCIRKMRHTTSITTNKLNFHNLRHNSGFDVARHISMFKITVQSYCTEVVTYFTGTKSPQVGDFGQALKIKKKCERIVISNYTFLKLISIIYMAIH